MKQGILYNGCSTTQALGLDPTNTQQPAMVSLDDPSAQWLMMPGFNGSNVPVGGIGLKNAMTGAYLTAYGGNLACGAVAGLAYDTWSTWDVGMSGDRFKPFRPVADTDLNISTGSCGAGAVPALRGWDGGQPYEHWSFIPNQNVADVRQYFQLVAQCGGVLTAQQGGGSVAPYPVQMQLQSATNDPSVWYVEVGYNTATAVIVGGMSIFSSWSGTALAYTQGNQATTLVGANVLDLKSTWNFGSDSGNNVAIRPQYDDDQNLNVFGGCASGSPTVGTYSWSGGQNNEVWTFNTPQQSGANRTS